MERCLELAGATYIDARTVSLQPPASELESDDRQILEIAIQPALITYYRTDTPNLKIRRISPTRGRLRAEGKRACETVKTILSQGEFVATYIPNGRFPSQKMAELAQREPSKEARNTFTASWTDQLPPALVAQMPEKKIAGVFTSSQDEFHFLGPEWHLHSWESKLEAFDTVLSHFEADGYLCNLRIHPNLATKSHDCFRREREQSAELARRHPNLVVISHDEPVNSYALLESTDAVVVC